MKLYSSELILRRKRAVTILRIVLLLLCAVALAGCVILMLRTGTGNALRSFWSCLILFTLAGWMVITVRQFWILPLRRVIAHEEGVLKSADAAITCSGVLSRAGVWFTLPSSITLMKMTLVTEDGENVGLSVEKSRLKCLPKDGARVKLSAVRGFITEVEHGA